MRTVLVSALNVALVMPGMGLHVDNPVTTDGFRCGTNRLVELGDSKTEVLEKCGPPASEVIRRGRWGKEELWTYDQGPTEFLRILQFDTRGLLTKIMLGAYGSGK